MLNSVEINCSIWVLFKCLNNTLNVKEYFKKKKKPLACETCEVLNQNKDRKLANLKKTKQLSLVEINCKL